jgi:PIN domain nuclease of toxin-antitoxin system
MFLDTNIIIRLLREPEKISSPVLKRLRDADDYRCTTLITFWEIAIKHRKGRLPMPAPFADAPEAAFDAWCHRAVIDILPIKPSHIALAMRLDFDCDDPFDRLIAAAAIVEGEELVTADKVFERCAGLRLLRV